MNITLRIIKEKGSKMEEQSNKGIAITLAVLLGIFLQVLFVFVDSQDTPNKAVVEFAKAYFQLDDEAMAERLCEDAKVVDDVDMIDQHIYLSGQKAKTLGYSLFYMKEKLYHVETRTVSKDNEKAEIRLICERKPPLQSFFTRRSCKIDETVNVIKENGRWKVCGIPFSLNEG